jgi:uncharacterized membrane protein YobD (UPF0266 family)
MSIYKEIEISLEWNKENALKSSKMFYEYDMRNSGKRYIGWLFVGLTQFAIVGALKHDAYGLLVISTFLVSYWYYLRRYLRFKMLERFYATLEPTVLKFILKEDGLYNGENLIKWDEIFRVISLEDGVLLHTNTNTLFFEKKAFKNYEEIQRFLEVMKAKGKK